MQYNVIQYHTLNKNPLNPLNPLFPTQLDPYNTVYPRVPALICGVSRVAAVSIHDPTIQTLVEVDRHSYPSNISQSVLLSVECCWS